jgi:hypothetical protein
MRDFEARYQLILVAPELNKPQPISADHNVLKSWFLAESTKHICGCNDRSRAAVEAARKKMR